MAVVWIRRVAQLETGLPTRNLADGPSEHSGRSAPRSGVRRRNPAPMAWQPHPRMTPVGEQLSRLPATVGGAA